MNYGLVFENSSVKVVEKSDGLNEVSIRKATDTESKEIIRRMNKGISCLTGKFDGYSGLKPFFASERKTGSKRNTVYKKVKKDREIRAAIKGRESINIVYIC